MRRNRMRFKPQFDYPRRADDTARFGPKDAGKQSVHLRRGALAEGRVGRFLCCTAILLHISTKM
jgi:hypothetical protein